MPNGRLKSPRNMAKSLNEWMSKGRAVQLAGRGIIAESLHSISGIESEPRLIFLFGRVTLAENLRDRRKPDRYANWCSKSGYSKSGSSKSGSSQRACLARKRYVGVSTKILCCTQCGRAKQRHDFLRIDGSANPAAHTKG